MTALGRTACCAAAAVIVLGLVSCSTINRLDPYEVQGARVAAQMPLPPEPRVRVAYDVTVSSRNPIFSALSVMTNLAKASQAEKANLAMRDALETVDVPAIVLAQTFDSCVDALGATPVDARADSDFYLVLDIRDWGIRADTPGSSVSLHMSVTASLVRSLGRDLVWQRRVSVDQPASPAMFGLGQILDTMVTATVLYEMTAEELATGFKEMARETSRGIVRVLRKDLDRARYGG